jgi:hypothetical protein
LSLVCCNLSDKTGSGDLRWRAPADPLLTESIQDASKVFLPKKNQKNPRLPSFSMSRAFLLSASFPTLFHVVDAFLLVSHFRLQVVTCSKSEVPSLVHSVLAYLRHTPLPHSPKTAYSLMSGRQLMPPLTRNCQCGSISKVAVMSLIPIRTTMGRKSSRSPKGTSFL